jgi:hypothetical protein
VAEALEQELGLVLELEPVLELGLVLVLGQE